MQADSVEINSSTENVRFPIQNYFIGWQCRVRELSLRSEGGRPNGGMRPQIALNNGEVLFPAATLLIIPEYTDETIRQLRFLGLKTQDPKERYTKALQLLSAKFYQNSEFFPNLLRRWKNLIKIGTALRLSTTSNKPSKYPATYAKHQKMNQCMNSLIGTTTFSIQIYHPR